jgi:NAD(P)-dependent dehydrogenase (short-subunit alcohol dehydrogenase family)
MYQPVADITPSSVLPTSDAILVGPPRPEISKVAIVTGASSGIGRVTSIALYQAGWNVVLSARRESELQETARLCAQVVAPNRTEADISSSKIPPLTLVVAGDVTKESDVNNLFKAAVDTYGTLYS